MFVPSRSVLRFLRQSVSQKPSKCQLTDHRRFSASPQQSILSPGRTRLASASIKKFKPPDDPRCTGAFQLRKFSASAHAQSGHSRWSKIKHDKAVKDGRTAKHRVLLAQDLILAVKLHGPDPAANPRLRTAIEKAKAAKFPKDSIENAIKRGQGISSSGKPLENVTIEAVLPAGVAVIVECQTESKLRTLTEVRAVITKGGGQPSPTQYMFNRRGKIVFKLGDVSPDTLMETALDLDGFIDMEGPEEGEETEEGQTSVLTEPNATKAVADAISEKLKVEITSLDIEWQPTDILEFKEDDPSYGQIQEIIDKLEDISEVQDVYVNI